MDDICFAFSKGIRCNKNIKHKYFCGNHSKLETIILNLCEVFKKTEEEIVNNLYYCKGCGTTKYKYNDAKICYECANKREQQSIINMKPKCKAITISSKLPCIYNAVKYGYCINHSYLNINLDADTFTFDIP